MSHVVPEWVIILFAASGIVLLAGFWLWTTRNSNKKK